MQRFTDNEKNRDELLQHNAINFTSGKNGSNFRYIGKPYCVFAFIPLHKKLLQFDWLRAVVFRLNLKYLHVKTTNLLWVVV